MKATPTHLYRYVRVTVSYNPLGEVSKGHIRLEQYRIKRETPQGYWIANPDSVFKDKWVSNNAKKRFAYPDKESAMTNFIKRTEHCIAYLTSQKKEAKAYLEAAQQLRADFSFQSA